MRLIDANKEWSEKASDNTGYTLEYYYGNYTVYAPDGSVVCEFLPNIPTAYNVDKVVDQIEDIMDDESVRFCNQAVRRSVNIVKAGGVNA